MRIKDFINHWADSEIQKFVISDIISMEDIFVGYGNEIPDNLLKKIITSIDTHISDCIVININNMIGE